MANVVKHGEGKSKSDLEKINPDLFDVFSIASNSFEVNSSILGGGLYIKLEDFQRYQKATIDFWDYNYWNKRGERFSKKK